MVECIGSQQQQLLSYSQRVATLSSPSQPQLQPLMIDTFNSQHQETSSGQLQLKLLAMYPQQQPQQQQQHLQRQQTLVELSKQQQQSSGQNELIGYYFGSISRETAEWILKTHGNQMDGAYLLRSSGPNDDFVLSIMVVNEQPAALAAIASKTQQPIVSLNANNNIEVLHYKIVETEDSFVALHGQVGDEKFATIDELIEKAQGVATKPKWPIQRQTLESQILPPTYWGLSLDQVRLAIFIKTKQWGFPLLSTLFSQAPQQQHADQQQQQQVNGNSNASETLNVNTLNNETIRTLIYKSLHEFQPWFHGKISREEAEQRIEEGTPRDGRFLVRERDNYSYAMCISHKRTTKHYRVDVLPTGELAIQDGRKFTSLMALVSHYTIMSDGLWCALTEACPRPIQANSLPGGTGFNITSGNNFAAAAAATSMTNSNNNNSQFRSLQLTSVAANQFNMANQPNLYCVPPLNSAYMMLPSTLNHNNNSAPLENKMGQIELASNINAVNEKNHELGALICNYGQSSVNSIKTPIKEWLQTINQKWSQLMASKNQQSLNSFLFGNQNPLNNHCRHNSRNHHHHHHHHHHHNHSHANHRRKCKNGHTSCGNCNQQTTNNSNTNRASAMMTLPHGNSQDAKNTGNDRKRQQQLAKMNKFLNGSATIAHNSCCSAASCPAIKDRHSDNNNNNFIPKNFVVRSNNTIGQAANTVATNPMLLSCMPQNNSSGFMLNSQSFIGSPLFAVKPTQAATGQISSSLNRSSSGCQQKGGHSSGSSNSGSGKDGIEEEKLISPAQSISANLNNHANNNPYNLNNDIYGSQATSTALMNSQLLTSSSSSSGTNMNIPSYGMPTVAAVDTGFAATAAIGNGNSTNNLVTSQQLAHLYGASNSVADGGRSRILPTSSATNTEAPHCATISMPMSMPISIAQQQQPNNNVNLQIRSTVTHVGRILCGQHAGPAYRYTNCNDESSFKPCFHRPLTSCRAADDSQLMTGSTQLAGPAAMAKFVQFQDGQCLRTHRDTRSIQMAYLSSKQTNNSSTALSNASQRQAHQRQQPVPFKELGKNLMAQKYQQQMFNNNSYLAKNFGQCGMSYNGNGTSQTINSRRQQQRNVANIHRQLNQQQHSQPAHTSATENITTCNDIDLMDCEEVGGGGFGFKYDPKLIKSSSIETLCGEGDTQEATPQLDLSNFKSNTELMMTLQSYWPPFDQNNKNSPLDNILSPIRPAVPFCDTLNEEGNDVAENNYSAFNYLDQDLDNEPLLSGNGSILSSLINTDSQHDEQLDQMKKKHDLDELTTALLAELTASLKAQVDLKNKRSGFGLPCLEKPETKGFHQQQAREMIAGAQNHHRKQQQGNRNDKLEQANVVEVNPLELVNEFDTLISNNNIK